jgi:hypothetical protein
MAIEHNLLANSITKSHGVVWQAVADAAALASMSIAAIDVAQRKIVLQSDTGQLWVPVSTTPTFTPLNNLTVSTQTGTNYTLSLGDGFVRRSNATACNCTIPTNAAVPFPVGTELVVEQSGVGALTILAAGGVTLNIPASRNATLAEQYSQVALKKVASDTWELLGDLGPILAATLPITLVAGAIGINVVSDTVNGAVPHHAGASDVGKALLATLTATSWSTNFGANILTSSGGFVGLSATAYQQLGLAPGSGAGSASSIGDIRLRNNTGAAGTGPLCYGRKGDDTTDLFLWGYDSSTPGFQIGNAGGAVTLSLIQLRAATVQVFGTSSVVLGVSTGGVSINAPNMKFDNTLTNPVIGVLPTAGATGTKLTIAGQQAVTTGGALDIAPGSAATGGLGRLTNAAITNQRYAWNDTGIGLYTATPIAQAARVGQLTDSTTGTPSTTLVDVGAVPTQANINNNFSSVLTKLNALELLIHNVGASA